MSRRIPNRFFILIVLKGGGVFEVKPPDSKISEKKIFHQPISLQIPPLQNRFFVFGGGGILKFLTELFLKGGVFSAKFSEKTQNVAAPAAGFLICFHNAE